MLENWLKPIPLGLTQKMNLKAGDFGMKIQRYEEVFPNLKKGMPVLLGIGETAANAVRNQLYGLSFPFGKMLVADLGNLRKEDNYFLIPLLQELLEARLCPVIIAECEKFIQAQCKAQNAVKPSVSLVHISKKVGFHPDQTELDDHYLNPVLNDKDQVFHFCSIGCQSHFTDEKVFNALAKLDYDCIRLGKAKTSISDTEPFIRDADLVTFHLDAIKASDAPGVESPSPSGFTCEEACQLSRYAGMNDKLSSVGFYGFYPKNDSHHLTAKVLSQLIWYFLDGYHSRKHDFPASMHDLTEYIVDFKGLDFPLTFWKSNKTGRWWIQTPVKTKKNQDRHRLIPCAYNDYLTTLKGELPERIVSAFRRFT